MAGDWIKWCKGLAERREVKCMASLLGRDKYEIAGRLMKLWEWCDDNFSDADIVSKDDVSLFIGDKPGTEIDDTTGVPGFAAAMQHDGVRWLRIEANGMVTFPNLARHNGSSSKQRATAATKKRNQRDKETGLSPICPELKGTTSGPEQNREEKNIEPSARSAEQPLEDFPNQHSWMAQFLADQWKFEKWLIETWEGFEGVLKYGKPKLDDNDQRAMRRCLEDPTFPIEKAFDELASHGMNMNFKPDLSWMFKESNTRKVSQGAYRTKFTGGKTNGTTKHDIAVHIDNWKPRPTSEAVTNPDTGHAGRG